MSAIAYHAGLKRPTVSEWDEVNRLVPRLVDVLPNGPNGFSTAQFFLAGGVPELMLKLRELNLLDLEVLTCTGLKLGENLEAWEKSERRIKFLELLMKQDNVDPQDAVHSKAQAIGKGMTSTVCFPLGNLAPEGSVIKSTQLMIVWWMKMSLSTDLSTRATTEREAVRAVKGLRIKPRRSNHYAEGLMGAGMEEGRATGTQAFGMGKQAVPLTDARFCISKHVLDIFLQRVLLMDRLQNYDDPFESKLIASIFKARLILLGQKMRNSKAIKQRLF